MNEDQLHFSKTHEWVFIDGTVALIGVSRFAIEQLNDVVYVELPEEGQQFKAGDVFGAIESVKAASDLYTPVAGTVAEVNQPVADEPSVLSDDPYENGWMVKLTVADSPDLSQLMDKDAYDKFCQAEGH